MTGFAATHTGSLTPSSNPWKFVGTVIWQSDIDPAILPDNEPVVLRLAFTTLDLTGATITFAAYGPGRAATLPANGPFDGSTDYIVASHKDRPLTYTITGVGPVGSGALAMRARSENYELFTAGGTLAAPSGPVRFDLAGEAGKRGTGGGTITGGAGGRVVGALDLSGSATVSMSGAGSHGTSYDPSDNHGGDGGNATIVADGATTLLVAGGGGGGGRDSYSGTARGGAGGGLVGVAGEGWYSGGGGTQSAGGAPGGSGLAGSSLQGGDGGDGLTIYKVGGGGGGGGYYGGGGGGGELTIWGNQLGASGGGGSSYTDPSAAGVTHTQGGSLGTAYALFAWGFVDLFAGDAIPSASGWHIGSLRFGSTAVAGGAFTGWT